MSTLTTPEGHDSGASDRSNNSQLVPAGESSPSMAEATPPGTEHVTQSSEAHIRRRKRRLVIAAVALTALALGAYGLVALGVLGGESEDASATADGQQPVTISAVTAQQQDLVEYTDLDGTLTYADSRTVAVAASGTVTAIVEDGQQLERGDTLYEVNAVPTVLFYGDIPLYRTLSDGSEGDDVMVLEANLASLTYHLGESSDDEVVEVDTGFVVDGVFDAATTEAVQRWQADLAVEETGTVDPTMVAVTSGSAVATGVNVAVGDIVQAGTPAMGLNISDTTEAFYNPRPGVVALEAGAGPVTSGQVLFVIDDLPVTAMVTDEAFDRALNDGVDDGDDVLALEEMLVSLGYDARGDLIPDDEFDELTTEAIEAWEEDLQDVWEDQVIDGDLDLDQIVLIEPGTAIGDTTERDGEEVAGGSELFTWNPDDGSGGRVVLTAIDVAEQERLSEGQTVDIEFPDNSLQPGTVATVATSSTINPANPDAEPTLAVEITLATVPDAYAGLNELDVIVKLVDELAAGVTVVPASALAATGDGGYAVEVVDGTSTSFVAVETGMFADGFVEVTGIEPGTAVVVPS